MSQHSPKELEAIRQKLVAAGRSERPDPDTAKAGLGAVLDGSVVPEAFEAAPTNRKWLRRSAYLLGVAGILFIGWQLTRPGEEHVVPPVAMVAAVSVPDAAVLVAEARGVPQVQEVLVIDAGPPVVEVVDAGPAVAAVVQVAPKQLEEDDALARELALLDDARKHVNTDPLATLKTLSRYGRSFPRGSLKLEAEVVQLEALLNLNRRADAEKLAGRLIKNDREGLVKERVERLLKDHP